MPCKFIMCVVSFSASTLCLSVSAFCFSVPIPVPGLWVQPLQPRRELAPPLPPLHSRRESAPESAPEGLLRGRVLGGEKKSEITKRSYLKVISVTDFDLPVPRLRLGTGRKAAEDNRRNVGKFLDRRRSEDAAAAFKLDGFICLLTNY